MGQELMTVDDIGRMAKALVDSKLFPEFSTIQKAATMMMVCQSEGIHPMQAVKRYHIIKDKPAMKADAMLADFHRNGGKTKMLEYTDQCVKMEFEHSQSGKFVIDWDMKRAAQAGLAGRDNWKKYPRAMLKARVVSEGIRIADPAVCAGLYTPEEVRDFDNSPSKKQPPAETPAQVTNSKDPLPAAKELDKAPATAPMPTPESQGNTKVPPENLGTTDPKAKKREGSNKIREKFITDLGATENGQDVEELISMLDPNKLVIEDQQAISDAVVKRRADLGLNKDGSQKEGEDEKPNENALLDAIFFEISQLEDNKQINSFVKNRRPQLQSLSKVNYEQVNQRLKARMQEISQERGLPDLQKDQPLQEQVAEETRDGRREEKGRPRLMSNALLRTLMVISYGITDASGNPYIQNNEECRAFLSYVFNSIDLMKVHYDKANEWRKRFSGGREPKKLLEIYINFQNRTIS